MTPGHDDDLDWLYRAPAGDESAPKQPAFPSDERRRVSFGEPADAARPTGKRTRVAPTPAPPPQRSGQRPRPSSGSRGGGQPPAPPRGARGSRPRRPGRSFMRAVGLLLVAWLVFLIGTPVYAWSSTTKIDAMPTGDRPAPQPGDLWLLVGSDSREGLTEEERSKLGTGDIEGQRTDTMLLLYVPPTGKPALISIPRDSYVSIPGYSRNKINAAYAFGGAPLLIQTVEQNTGLRVEHYAEVGFGGFVNVIDALGGIEMCPKTAIQDKFSKLDVPAGCQNMDGPTALGYVRMRYADPYGDLGRMHRQREMVAGVIDKAASPATVLNPIRWWQLNNAAAEALHTDQDTGVLDLVGLARPMVRLGSGDGYTFMVPVSNPNAHASVGSVMIWDDTETAALFEAIRRGDTSGFGEYKNEPGE